MSKICSQCGNECDDLAKICPACGASLSKDFAQDYLEKRPLGETHRGSFDRRTWTTDPSRPPDPGEGGG